MAILANRVKSVNIVSDFFESVRNYLAKSIAIILILTSTLLIYSSDSLKVKKYIFDISASIIGPITTTYDTIINHITDMGDYFRDILNAKSENIALKLENTKLNNIIEEAARLKAENLLLKKQLKFKETKEATIQLSTRLISNYSGMHLKGGIIGAGKKDGIEDNQIVANNGKIIGRVSYLSDNYAKVMFINDIKSRIPIITSISREKAILTGDGHEGGKLLYVADGHKIKQGEFILSSGDGKYYPYGIPIAKVIKVENINIYVEPLVDLSKVQFVNLLKSMK